MARGSGQWPRSWGSSIASSSRSGYWVPEGLISSSSGPPPGDPSVWLCRPGGASTLPTGGGSATLGCKEQSDCTPSTGCPPDSAASCLDAVLGASKCGPCGGTAGFCSRFSCREGSMVIRARPSVSLACLFPLPAVVVHPSVVWQQIL